MTKKNDGALIRPGVSAIVRWSEPGEDLITPVADILETADFFVVKLDMPGATKDGIRLTLESNVLIVQGAVRSVRRERMNMLRREVVALNYYREFNISDDILSDGIEAEFENGVLTMKLQKAQHAKKRDIPIT